MYKCKKKKKKKTEIFTIESPNRPICGLFSCFWMPECLSTITGYYSCSDKIEKRARVLLRFRCFHLLACWLKGQCQEKKIDSYSLPSYIIFFAVILYIRKRCHFVRITLEPRSIIPIYYIKNYVVKMRILQKMRKEIKLTDLIIEWLSACMPACLIDWLADWLADWLTDWLTGWLTDLNYWLTSYLPVCLPAWLTDLFINLIIN